MQDGVSIAWLQDRTAFGRQVSGISRVRIVSCDGGGDLFEEKMVTCTFAARTWQARGPGKLYPIQLVRNRGAAPHGHMRQHEPWKHGARTGHHPSRMNSPFPLRGPPTPSDKRSAGLQQSPGPSKPLPSLACTI
ncbi:hypothetical protein OPT61_g8663 [Boeremia exigua]|uniref:Uncharacterized protein n=1 Tax=Boeremia exigua TaxID=749465 RepID=A0ACC2HY68_9PLEO|nr:hypothetical protein OPT61_g8663 [Boeremia exigua]